jgi:hypothetical protein
MRITRILIAVSVACVFTGMGCTKGPAEQALKVADEAIQAAQPAVQPYVPEQWRLLTDAAEAAHNDFERGNYKAALDAAKSLPGRIEQVKTMAQARKDELTMVWQQMGASVPAMLSTMSGKVNEIAATGKMPPGMTREAFEAEKTEMVSLIGLWSEAQSAAQAGNVAEATEMGAQVETRAESLLHKLGVKPEPTTAAGAKPAATAPPAGAQAPAPVNP